MRYFLRSFILSRPVEKFSWISFFVWFTDSNAEKILLEELELAAQLGFDCFLHDARKLF